jgi:superfamily II DNA or RNA helicase
MIPRPYQSRLVSRAKSALEKHGNTLCVAPTGAGKTIMLSLLVSEMQPAKTLVLQHRDELVSQNLSKFQKVNPGLPVSLFTADTKSWRGKTTFAMVQTLSRENNLETIPRLDLVVVDEAHHVAAATYRRILEAAKAKNDRCLVAGFTATPLRGDKKGLRSVFSNVADQITLKELISRGFLVPPRAFVIDVNGVREGLGRVRKLKYDFDMNEVAEVMNKKVVNDEVIRQWKEHAPDRKTVVFCSTVHHATDVTGAFRAAGISTEMLTGDTPDAERVGIIRRLKAGATQVVVNVAVLTEGFDEPSISCVVLLRPCSYKSTMIQMIGRGLRTINPDEYPGFVKKDCIILDFGSSILTHGDINADVSLDGGEKKGEEHGAGPFKTCPESPDETDYLVPDRNGNIGCGGQVPTGAAFCPLCGFLFERPQAEPADQVILTEVDLLDSSPFRWVDLFGSGKAMLASGFAAWAGVFSPDGQNWFALGKEKESKMLTRIHIGDRLQALAAADDFLRERETSGNANKSRRWMKQPASDRQRELLTKVGYEMAPLDFNFTKYTAATHLNFQWHRRQIEAVLFQQR